MNRNTKEGFFTTYTGNTPPPFFASILAGTGVAGSMDGTRNIATFNQPSGLHVDSTGNVYIGDTGNHLIRKIDIYGIVSTIAGTGTAGFSGDGAAAIDAELNRPTKIKVDSAGNIYFSDTGNNRVRKIDTAGKITTIAGNGTVATLSGPTGLAFDSSNNLYISCSDNSIKKLVGTTLSTFVKSDAGLNGNIGIAIDNSNSIMYIAESTNNLVRRININNNIIIGFIGNSASTGISDGPLVPGSITIKSPKDIAIAIDANSLGNLYITDANKRIKIMSGPQNGYYAGSTLIGSGTSQISLTTPISVTSAAIGDPVAIAVNSLGSVYFTDTSNRIFILYMNPTGATDAVCPANKAVNYAKNECQCASGFNNVNNVCTACTAGNYSLTGYTACSACPTLATCTTSTYTCSPNSTLNPGRTECACNRNYLLDGTKCIPDFIKTTSQLPKNTTGSTLSANRNIINGDIKKTSDTYIYNWKGNSGSINANPCNKTPSTPIFDFDSTSNDISVYCKSITTTPPPPAPAATATSTAPTQKHCCEIKSNNGKNNGTVTDGYIQNCKDRGSYITATLNATQVKTNPKCKGVTTYTDAAKDCFTYAQNTQTNKWRNCPLGPPWDRTSPFEDMDPGETMLSKRGKWFQNRQLLNSA